MTPACQGCHSQASEALETRESPSGTLDVSLILCVAGALHLCLRKRRVLCGTSQTDTQDLRLFLPTSFPFHAGARSCLLTESLTYGEDAVYASAYLEYTSHLVFNQVSALTTLLRLFPS